MPPAAMAYCRVISMVVVRGCEREEPYVDERKGRANEERKRWTRDEKRARQIKEHDGRAKKSGSFGVEREGREDGWHEREQHHPMHDGMRKNRMDRYRGRVTGFFVEQEILKRWRAFPVLETHDITAGWGGKAGDLDAAGPRRCSRASRPPPNKWSCDRQVAHLPGRHKEQDLGVGKHQGSVAR